LFGSNRLMIKPTAEVNPLDNAERLLTAERDKLQGAASRPIVQFLWRDEAKKMADEAAQKSLQIQQIQEKKQQQQTNQALARNMGLTRGMSPTAGLGDITEEALREWRENGNYDAYRGLHGAGQGARADLYMDEGVSALGKQTEAAQRAVEQLNSATNQSEYNSIRSNVLKHPDFSSLGMNEGNLPKYRTEWEQKRGAVTAKLNSASQVVEQFKQKQASLSQAVPIVNKEAAEAVVSNLTGFEGAPLPNLKAVSLPGAGGAQGGLAQPGSKDIAHFGPDGWNNATPENVKVFNEELTAAVPKQDREKYVAFNRVYEGATHDSKGNALPADKINTNPNIQQGIAEGLASTLRGGAGGANVGLLKIELAKRGWAQTAVDGIISNIAGTGAVTGKERDYLSSLTQKQVRDVMDFIKGYSDKDMSARMAGAVNRAGTFGIGLDKLGLEPDLQEAAKGVWQAGVEKTRLKYDEYPAIIKGDRRVILPQDAQVPGMIPAGSYAKGLPKAGQGGNGEIAPSQGPANATLTNGSSSGPGGGGGAPASGISPDYLIKTAKVESGNEPDPWGSGNSKTSASGAFQFTNATWNQYKPPGAPNRAAEATPQQQTEAANNLTNANAKVLARNDIPVNDTTAYIAHNLGAAGAVNFMKARDDAKARAVVGEVAANNNPLFFKGDPTVAEAKARYAKVMNQPTAEQVAAYNANREGFAATRAKMAASATHNAANIAPALGAVAGMPLGPAGVVAGGAAGGAVRQGFNGGPGYVDQMARGALEAVPAAIPGVRPLATAARVVAGSAVPAAEKLYDTGGEDTAGAIESGAAGAVGGIIGEGAGIFGHALWSKLGPGPQKELTAAAKVLATQEPKIADAAGKMVPNPAYAKAKQDIEAIGKNPDEVAHNTRAMMAGTPKGETLAKRPAEIERVAAGRDLEGVRQDVKEAGVQSGTGALQPAARLPDDPKSTIETGKVPGSFQKIVDWAQMNVNAPAKSVDQKWNQLGEVRTKLLKAEMKAKESGGETSGITADAMRDIADSVRAQQVALIKMVKPGPEGQVIIQRLETADKRYARAMAAGAGEKGDIVKAIAKGGAEGREAQAAFDALAGNDPAAKRMVRSLVEMEKSKLERFGVGAAIIGGAQLLHMVPVVGSAAATAITAVKAGQMIRDYMVKRGAGASVTFKTILDRELGHARRAGSVVGSSIGNQMAQ
jgi:hypothetical protein